MNLKDLKQEIPFKWRVQSFSKNKPSCSCVPYIDARDAMDLLDEVCGAENWQDDYKLIDGKLFAGIGIKINADWVWKWDCGVESNMEKEKGQSSDAFKRACVKWGIGRFLYKMDAVYLNANTVKSDGTFPYPVDKSGKRIWDITEYINAKQFADKAFSNENKVTNEEIKEIENEWSQTPATAPANYGKCNCGAEKVLNPKTGKVFCKEKCWLEK